MKKNILLIALVLIQTQLFGQVEWEWHEIEFDSQLYPSDLFSVDLDGDGDMDIICGNHGYNSIQWYENIDGSGTFDTSHFVADGFDKLTDVIAADLDADGDMDIVASSRDNNEISWFENTDGLGTFGPRQIFSHTIFSPMDLDVADLDNDNDLDVLVAADSGIGGTWHENLDGLGSFGPSISVIPNNSWTQMVRAGDMDGDGDMDFLLCESLSGYIRWSKNIDGQGNFGPQILITDLIETPTWISIIDMDLDGNLDILTNTYGNDDGDIMLIRNLDGLGNFGSPEIIADVGYRATTIFPYDFDGDNDIDIVLSGNNGVISWVENLGDEIFGPQQPFGFFPDPRSMYPKDIDNDGDIDFVVLSYIYGAMGWLERSGSNLAVETHSLNAISVTPNPASELVLIDIPNSDTILGRVHLFSANGKEVLTSSDTILDISNFSPGIYFVQIITSSGIIHKKLVKE
ncbi:MAG: hypothetical protein Aureis2KO_01560 [Aureisphaera sp.]